MKRWKKKRVIWCRYLLDGEMVWREINHDVCKMHRDSNDPACIGCHGVPPEYAQGNKTGARVNKKQK